MTDPATDRPDGDDAAPRPTGIRQVQGALGSSQGSAGAAHAAPVLQPGAEGTPPPEADRPGPWATDKSPEEQIERQAEGLPRQGGDGSRAERNDRGRSHDPADE